MRTFVIVAALAGAGLAQANPPAPPRQERVLVDAVAATVNDSPIMLSTVMIAANDLIAQEARRIGGPVPPAIVHRRQREMLEKEIMRHRMAQSAKTFGPLTPAQVEQLLDEQIERDRDDQMRDLGGLGLYTAELARSGRTWLTQLREERIDKLERFAQELAVGRRLSRQTNLYVTPRMLREAYEIRKDQFVHAAEASIAQIAFLGPDGKERAAAAAAAWRADPKLDPRQVAQKGNGMVISVLPADQLSAQFQALREFALAGPEGAVSEPIAIGDAAQPQWNIAKIVRFRAAANDRFEDPKVQRTLREMCEMSVRVEFLEQARQRAEDRTQVRTFGLFGEGAR
jgi:hypothetical protein